MFDIIMLVSLVQYVLGDIMKETIWIDRDIDAVWDFEELEFAKIFKCCPKNLNEKY